MRDRPARRSGSCSSFRLRRASTMSAGFARVKRVPGPGNGVSARRPGGSVLACRKWLTSVGLPPSRPASSTLQRQAAARVSPDLHLADRGRRVPRDQTNAHGIPAGNSLRANAGDTATRARPAQQPCRERGRSEVCCPGKPESGRAEYLSEQPAPGVPDKRSGRHRIGVPFASVGQHVNPPPGRRRLPHAHPGRAVQQPSDVAQSWQAGNPEEPVALRVSLVWSARRGENPRTQLRRAHRGSGSGQRGDDGRDRAGDGNPARHQAPSSACLAPDNALGWPPPRVHQPTVRRELLRQVCRTYRESALAFGRASEQPGAAARPHGLCAAGLWAAGFWAAGFWAAGFWAAGFWAAWLWWVAGGSAAWLWWVAGGSAAAWLWWVGGGSAAAWLWWVAG